MKILFFLIIFLVSVQSISAQTKVDEYELMDSDSESARIDNFLSHLQNQPDSKGLIIICSGEDNERLGNIWDHIEGIRSYLFFRSNGAFTDRVSFRVDNRKQPLFKEFWIFPKHIPPPEARLKVPTLENLKNLNLFASRCEECDPVVPALSANSANFELYAALLEKYPDYKSLVIIYPLSDTELKARGLSKKESRQLNLSYAIKYRDILSRQYKISRRRISIKIAKPDDRYRAIRSKFFIVPK